MAEEVSILDFIPLYPEETEDVIRARWQAWANEGLTEDNVEEWTDVREGSFWWIATAPGIREAANLYDLIGTELVAAGIPFWAWGEYLDDHASTVTVERLAATPAAGEVVFTAPDGLEVAAGTVLATEPTLEDAEPREYQTTEGGIVAGGSLTLPVEALVAGSYGNVPAGAVNLPQTPLAMLYTVTNPEPMIGGTDPETDAALQERLRARYRGRGPGTAADYEVWARAYGGVGRVTVVPLWDGPGTVLVIALTEEGGPVSDTVVDGLQALLDPTPAEGAGDAPVGPTVTVATAAPVDVDVAITVELDPGYSLDGSGGSVNVSAAIQTAVETYLSSVVPGGEIVRSQILARVASVTGVHDAALPTLNGAGANLTLTSNPAQVAELDALSVTAGTL